MHRFDKLSVMPKTEQTGGTSFLEKNLKGNENLAVWDGELYLEMHRGTFTTKSNLKRENRELEFALREAELLLSLRCLSGETYPAEQVRDIYKKFLVNQFHDILPGSHIHPVYEDAMEDYKKVRECVDSLIGTGDTYFNSLGRSGRKLPLLRWRMDRFCGKEKKVHLCARRWHRLRPWMQADGEKGTASGRKTGGLDYSQICR